jgi:hypothetical protein
VHGAASKRIAAVDDKFANIVAVTLASKLACMKIAQLERELLDDEHCKPLRALAEHHVFERLHRHTQLLVLGVKRERHLGQIATSMH